MTVIEQKALNASNGSGSAVQTMAMTGLASTADAVNRKVDVAFGRPTVCQPPRQMTAPLGYLPLNHEVSQSVASIG